MDAWTTFISGLTGGDTKTTVTTAPPNSSSNTMMYLGIGLGVIAIVGLIIYFTKSK